MIRGNIIPPPGIHWLSDEEYARARTQLRMQFAGVLSIFDSYGQGVYIPQAAEELTKLAEDFGLRVRGVDKPISLELLRANGRRRR